MTMADIGVLLKLARTFNVSIAQIVRFCRISSKLHLKLISTNPLDFPRAIDIATQITDLRLGGWHRAQSGRLMIHSQREL